MVRWYCYQYTYGQLIWFYACFIDKLEKYKINTYHTTILFMTYQSVISINQSLINCSLISPIFSYHKFRNFIRHQRQVRISNSFSGISR